MINGDSEYSERSRRAVTMSELGSDPRSSTTLSDVTLCDIRPPFSDRAAYLTWANVCLRAWLAAGVPASEAEYRWGSLIAARLDAVDGWQPVSGQKAAWWGLGTRSAGGERLARGDVEGRRRLAREARHRRERARGVRPPIPGPATG